MRRHHGRVSISQPPFRWQMPRESRSHLLWGSCKLSGLLRAAESCEVQGKCKGFVEGSRWREGPTHWLECCTCSFVEHFTPISGWVQNATEAEWWQFAPSFYSHCTIVNVKTRWNSAPQSQQVICLELYPIWLFCIQQISSHDTGYSWKMYSVEFSSSSGDDFSWFSHESLFCCWVDHADRSIFSLLHLNSLLFLISFYSLLYPTLWVSCLCMQVWFGETQ